ncbi:MAG: MinD/ParA family protein [Oculatellaceae cyanobacterium Prado106]|jgi:MinD-like ATPase involved in chromosome partitioning or flagellar assembly|nr:MinD/ParA family protein [Oculatellaceae cyanobacterium Prado106]
MAKIVLVHSFRGGTGKSNTTANLATAIACTGQQVAVIDTDIQSPGIHILFGLEQDTPLKYTLNDYLWGNCAIEDAAYDVSPEAAKQNNGRVFLLPSSIEAEDMTRILHEGYDVRLLKNGFRSLVKALNLDYIFVDTHPGLNEETLLSIATANILVVILRPDRQDLQGTAVMVDLARQLKVPKMLIVVNRVLQDIDINAVRQQIESKYDVPVVGVLPNCDEMMRLGSSALFCLEYPDHPLTQEIKTVAQSVMT